MCNTYTDDKYLLTCKWQLAGDVDALHDHSPPDLHHRSDDDDDYGHDDESQFTIIIIFKYHHSLRNMCKSFTGSPSS